MTIQETDHIITDLHALSGYNTEQAYTQVLHTIAQRQKSRRRHLWTSISAVAALIAIVLSLWVPYERVSNPSKQVLTLVLPDHSEVTLNQGASIVYAKQMTKKRHLKLKGEAFFNIQKDTAHPFIIKTGKHQVKVVGTSFNVKAIEGEKTFEVEVKSGRVEVSHANGPILSLGQGESVKSINGKLVYTPTLERDANALSWYEQKMHFDASPLHYVIKTIENTYHTPVILADKSLDTLKISTTFDGLSQEEVLTSICLTLKLNFKKESDSYLIYQTDH